MKRSPPPATPAIKELRASVWGQPGATYRATRALNRCSPWYAACAPLASRPVARSACSHSSKRTGLRPRRRLHKDGGSILLSLSPGSSGCRGSCASDAAWMRPPARCHLVAYGSTNKYRPVNRTKASGSGARQTEGVSNRQEGSLRCYGGRSHARLHHDKWRRLLWYRPE